MFIDRRRRTTSNKRNAKCPLCKEPMDWTEGLLIDGSVDFSHGRYSCVKCGVLVAPTDSRDTRKGKRMAEKLPLDISCMDERITSQNAAVQVGILRAQQHCKTCSNNMGDPCTCEGKCNCLYCRRNDLMTEGRHNEGD